MTEYAYYTFKFCGGYAAAVRRMVDGEFRGNASFQDGFKCRHKAYRYARSMARCLGRNHAWVN